MQQDVEWGFWRTAAGLGRDWPALGGFWKWVAGKRLSGMGSSLTWTFGEHVLQGIVAVPLEVVGCGGDAVEAGGEDDCEGEVLVAAIRRASGPDLVLN